MRTSTSLTSTSRVRTMRKEEDKENSIKLRHAISFRNPTGQPLTGRPVFILARQYQLDLYSIAKDKVSI